MLVHIVVVDVRGDVRKELPADLISGPVEDDEVDRHVVLHQELADGVHRHPERLVFGVAVGPGGDKGKGHRFAAQLPGQRKACPIAGNQLFPLAVFPVLPHRANRMYYIFAGQAVSPRDFGLAGFAPAQGSALRQQLRPRRPVDTAVHAAAAQQALVGRVDDGVHRHFRYVVSYDLQRHPLTSRDECRCSFHDSTSGRGWQDGDGSKASTPARSLFHHKTAFFRENPAGRIPREDARFFPPGMPGQAGKNQSDIV